MKRRLEAWLCVITLCVVGAVFSGCATVKPQGTLSPVYITNTKAINLLPPQCMNGAIDNFQQLQGKFGDQTFSLLVYFQSDDTGIFMALLNDFGTDMGSITYDGNYVELESTVFPQNLKAEYIIADIQNAFYNSDAVKENLTKSKLTYREGSDNNVSFREIYSGKKLIESIRFEESAIIITNYLRGYEYKLIEAN